MWNFIKNLFTPLEPIEVRRQRVWEEQREYERRNEEKDLALIEAMAPEIKAVAAERARYMTPSELINKLRELNRDRPLGMPGGHIDLFYELDQETKDVYIAELLSRGKPE